MSPEPVAPPAQCYRHPGRETLLSCSSCGRPICTDCMTQAPVGIRCPECRGHARGGDLGAIGLRGGAHGAMVTWTLIALNVVIFAAEMVQGSSAVSGVSGSIVADGGLSIPGVADGGWYRLVTSAFLHSGLLHIGFNMYALYWLGVVLERYAGSVRMLVVYAESLMAGSAGALLADRITGTNHLTVGASGAIFGLLAALLVLQRHRGVALLGGALGAVLVLNLVLTFLVPGLSIGGHLGGIVGGALAAWILSGYGRGHLAHGRLTPAVALGLLALLGASLGVIVFAVG